MDSTWMLGLAGGALIGAGSLLAMIATKKVPGISGVFGRLFRPKSDDSLWRIIFLIGMLLGGGVMFSASDQAQIYRVPESRSMAIYLLAGLLVGFGTRYGGGCTSGHGVCGNGMGARDSMIATVIFMLAGILTVLVFGMEGAP